MANASLIALPLITPNFSTPSLDQLLNQLSTTKLDQTNYLLWKTLPLPILKSYKLESLVGTDLIKMDSAVGIPSMVGDVVEEEAKDMSRVLLKGTLRDDLYISKEML
ncbi:uncharacterized protein E5676_scaffold1503G00180 [Cucumis melo var. makuwa]|uniref:Uncharacterized protein n=1 Tax=Cucumis melo var. makuwa TaxID=1194695 RepID=A0A5A7UVH8_CUCMM|nr:uncharacterized protein E6C27_scaffold280G004110 [Cucumis melo var. makuwa]TYK08202.1 uncharacterized protein E5676_scaffold1503G00180 [Cucumis melo var. makuwa]